MVLTLTGQNSFGLQAELRKRVDVFVNEHGDLALQRIDGQETEFAKMREALTSLLFLADRQLVVLRSPSTNKQFVEAVEQVLGEVPQTTDVIIVEPKLDKRLSYYKYLKSKTDFREFKELDESELAGWLLSLAKEQGGSLSSADARYLVERVSANQQLLSNELEKLVLYDPQISRQTIDVLTEPTPQSTIFELLEAAFAGQRQTVSKLYAEQRAQKVEVPQIIALLSWQLHVLAIIKAAGNRSADDIAREAKLNPFVVRKSQSIARNLSLTQLKKLIHDLLQIDLRSKRTNLDPDEALQYYLLSLV